MKNKAVFLDRDGVINRDYDYVYRIEDFEFIPEIFDICRIYQSQGHLLIVVTNQSGIGRGYYSESDFLMLNTWMLEQLNNKGIHITDVYYCPHHINSLDVRYSIDCTCRKPKPGMILNASEKYSINLSESVFIGDKIADMQAGMSAGIKNNILIPRNEKERYVHPNVNMFESHYDFLKYMQLNSII